MHRFDKKKAQELLFKYGVPLEMLVEMGMPEFDADMLGNLDYADYVYEPNEGLKRRLQEYLRWCDVQDGEDPGKLMEEIVFLAFICLKGWNEVQSYRSASAQHDLKISGSNIYWTRLLEYLHQDRMKSSILIEAKNLKNSVSSAQFRILCYAIENQFAGTCGLGVFFTTNGASGFKDKYLRDARAIQALFHARTNKYVVVFDKNDIAQLSQIGALPRLLRQKVHEIESGSPISLEDGSSDSTRKLVQLPPHLAQHMPQLSGSDN